MFTSSYFKKWLAFTLILSLLPLAAQGVFSYRKAAGDIRDKVDEGNALNLEQMQIRLEQVLKGLEYSVTQFANSSLLTAALNQNLDLNDYKQINDLSKSLNNLQYELGFRSTYLINLDHDWVISDYGFGKFTELQDRERFVSYGKTENNLFWVIDQLPDPASGVKTNSLPLTITLVGKLPLLGNTQKARAMIVIRISNLELNRFLLNHSPFGELYVLDQQNRVLLGPQEGITSVRAMVERVKDAGSLREQGTGSFETKLNDKRVWVSYRTSNHYGWTYMAVLPEKQITRQSRNIGFFTVGISIVILLITVFAAWYGTRQLYRPLRRLALLGRETDSQAGVRDEAAQASDELSVIENRLHALMKTGSDLNLKVLDHTQQLREFYVMKLLLGQMSGSEMKTKLDTYHYPADWSRLLVMNLQIDSLEGTRYESKDRDLLLYAINNIVSELIPESNRFTPVLVGESQATLLASKADHDADAVHECHRITELVQKAVRQYLNITVSVGISRPFTALGDAPQARLEAEEALKYRARLGPEAVLYIDNIAVESPRQGYSQFRMLEQELVDAVKLGNEAAARHLLRDLMQQLVSREMSHGEYQTMLVQLLARLTALILDAGFSYQGLFGDASLVDALNRCRTLSETEEWLWDKLILPILSGFEKQNKAQYNQITESVIRFIQEEYGTSLSLESCAARLHFHPVYVSRVFKKETGISFSEYLVQHRLNLAKKWLLESDMRISDIAERLNYTNSATFIRSFSKFVGMTPGQYRKEGETK